MAIREPEAGERQRTRTERTTIYRPEPEDKPLPKEDGTPPLARALTAELLGTFALTFVAAGAEIVAARTGREPEAVARAVAPGLTVMAMIYALGSASGAHINPGATLAFALRGAFPWLRLPLYWMAQVLGAVLAALALRVCLGNYGHLGATLPKFGVNAALGMEIFLATVLFTVILSTAEQNSRIGKQAALPVGGVVALSGLFAGPVSMASMNPARSLGPAIVAGHFDGVWIYVAGPLLASGIAALLCAYLVPKKDPEREKAAQGEAG